MTEMIWDEEGKHFEWLEVRGVTTEIKLIKPYTMGGIAVLCFIGSDGSRYSKSFRNVKEAKAYADTFMRLEIFGRKLDGIKKYLYNATIEFGYQHKDNYHGVAKVCC